MSNPTRYLFVQPCPRSKKARIVHACVDKDITVSLIPDLYEIMLARVRLKQVDDVPVFTIGQLSISPEYMFLKRVTDIALSLLLLLLTAPLCLLEGLAIKLDSRVLSYTGRSA